MICKEISNIKNSAKVGHLEKLIYSTRLERGFLRNKNNLEGKLYQVLEIEREEEFPWKKTWFWEGFRDCKRTSDSLAWRYLGKAPWFCLFYFIFSLFSFSFDSWDDLCIGCEYWKSYTWLLDILFFIYGCFSYFLHFIHLNFLTWAMKTMSWDIGKILSI